MANQLNSGSLDTLKVGQTLLTKVFKTKREGMVQIEIAEKVSNPNSTSALGEGFTTFYSFANGGTGKPRRFWNPIEAIYLEAMLDIENLDIENGEYVLDPETGKEYMDLNILNPTAYINPQTGEAVKLRMRGRVIETVEGKQYDIDNQRYKVNPSTKDPVLHDGNYIYNKNQILFVQDISDDLVLPHIFLTADTVKSTSAVKEDVIESMDLNML